MGGELLRLVAWNIFHAHAASPGVSPTWRSTLLGQAVEHGDYVHVNKTLVGAAGQILDRSEAHVMALQETPPWAVAPLARATGAQAEVVLTAPRLGPVRARGWLGRRMPDLVRTHEGNANVLLVREPWTIVPGTSETVRLNPPWRVRDTVRERRLSCQAALNWMWERRGMVVARLRGPEGAEVVVGSCHCHNDPRVADVDMRRAGEALLSAAAGRPAILAGDMNATLRRHPEAFAELEAAGLELLELVPPDPLRIDHVLGRRVGQDGPGRVWSAQEREIRVVVRGMPRRIRVSDHAPIETSLRIPPAPPAR